MKREVEDSSPSKNPKREKIIEISEDESEDEVWEEVDVNQQLLWANELHSGTIDGNSIEITIPGSTPKEKKTGISKRDRIIRQLEHKAHLLCLVGTCLTWNQFINDTLLSNTLLSRTPSDIIDVFNKKPIAKTKTQSNAISPTVHLEKLVSFWRNCYSVAIEDFILDNANALVCFLMNSNSFDPQIYTLLFIATCRSLGLETRLVASLAPVPLSFRKAKTQPDCITFLCEIYLHGHLQPIILDPVSGYVGVSTTQTIFQNVSYVIAFDRNNDAKDVTKRYTTAWASNALKQRLPQPSSGLSWWDLTLWLLSKSNRTLRDDVEDEVLLSAEANEVMPSSFAGFVNHPMYVLERHCKQNETVRPNSKQNSIGVYKKELIFPRSYVQKLATMEAWKREARSIKVNEIPFKVVKATKRRKKKEQEEEEGENELFGYWQTKEYDTPMVVDGIIPKNKFGNVEIFHPQMLPIGSLHITDASASVVARKLKMEFAKVVIGFNHTSGPIAVPIYQGIVIAEENEMKLMEGLFEHAEKAQANNDKKREVRVMERWKRFIVGSLGRARLHRDYLNKN